jgi:hypothetical protein
VHGGQDSVGRTEEEDEGGGGGQLVFLESDDLNLPFSSVGNFVRLF